MTQNLQDEMMDLMDVSSEIQDSLGRSYNVPDDIDEDDLMSGKSLNQFLWGISRNLFAMYVCELQSLMHLKLTWETRLKLTECLPISNPTRNRILMRNLTYLLHHQEGQQQQEPNLNELLK